MRPADLTRAQQRRFDSMALNQKAAHRELVEQGKLDHAAFTDGGVSKKTLRRMGHPFAREGASARGIVATQRKPKGTFNGSGRNYLVQYTKKNAVVSRKIVNQVSRGRINPLPINKQTGRLRKSFFLSGPVGNQMIVRMGFRAPYAGFVLSPKGTSKMIYRGFYSRSKNSSSVGDLGIIARRHRARSAALVQSLRARHKKP